MTPYRSPETAPRTGDPVVVLARGRWWRVIWWDCSWLREGPDGDPACTDCWRVIEPGEYDAENIEVDEVEGWLPSAPDA